jgi:hypothetical protein
LNVLARNSDAAGAEIDRDRKTDLLPKFIFEENPTPENRSRQSRSSHGDNVKKELRQQPLDVVTACRPADLRLLKMTVEALRRFIPFRRLYVFTARANFPRLRRDLGADDVELIGEETALPDMTLADLKRLTLPGFPKGAGWYFQQLLKFSFCFRNLGDDFYLIWDADTVPLRSMEFFDAEERMLFTVAEEDHAPYFQSYRKLLGEEPQREFSFVAQHMIVQKSILREMLDRIDARFPGNESWAWKIMRNLPGSGPNLFSEYETLGHFVKNHYPERASYRKLSWLRDGSQHVFGLPKEADLKRLAGRYEFATFESGQRPLRRLVRNLRARWKTGHSDSG